jgi:molybdate transport system ATP-binding protein
MSAEGALHVGAALSRGTFRLEVAFDVGAGETLALVGPNGAGKSSSVAVAAGLLRPERGRVTFGDEIWCDTSRGVDMPPFQRRVGYVPQEYALFPHLTVRDNVAYGTRARGPREQSTAKSAGEWTERLGLAELELRRVDELSSGQRQRVALARALSSGARVLLFDEPFASLDTSTRTVVRAELRGFLEDLRLPTLLVTHDATDAVSLGDRIAVLEEGRILQLGTAAELLARPRTRFVAELLGMNHYRAELAWGTGLREARVAGVIFHVLTPEPGGTVSLAFAPSAVTLSPERPKGSAQNAFQGRVGEVVPFADRVRVVLDCGVALAADIVPEAASSLTARTGQVLWASVKATAIAVYR